MAIVRAVMKNKNNEINYYLDSNKGLKNAIDELISSEKYFSQEINESLYTEYLSPKKNEILKEVHKETHKIFQNIFQASLSTNDLASDYSDKMEKYYMFLIC